MSDAVKIVLIACGIGFLGTYIFSTLAKFFIALRSPPSQRAMWIVSIGYLITTCGLLTADLGGKEYWFPVTNVPGAALAYGLWYWQFSKSWIGDPEDLPDGVKLANDDWRKGLILLVLALMAAAMKLAFRKTIAQ